MCVLQGFIQGEVVQVGSPRVTKRSFLGSMGNTGNSKNGPVGWFGIRGQSQNYLFLERGWCPRGGIPHLYDATRVRFFRYCSKWIGANRNEPRTRETVICLFLSNLFKVLTLTPSFLAACLMFRRSEGFSGNAT